VESNEEGAEEMGRYRHVVALEGAFAAAFASLAKLKLKTY
jgi:hypothetical protein